MPSFLIFDQPLVFVAVPRRQSFQQEQLFEQSHVFFDA